MKSKDHLPTRRQLLAGAAFVCGVQAAEPEISHAAESIHQERVFHASRKHVYEALLDTKLFDQSLREAMKSGMSLPFKPAEISRQVGGTFALFGGHILGRHVELAPHVRIVQAWRTSDWDPGVYSIARFELTEDGSATKLAFDHTGFPASQAQHLADGWNSHYWEPLTKYLA